MVKTRSRISEVVDDRCRADMTDEVQRLFHCRRVVDNRVFCWEMAGSSEVCERALADSDGQYVVRTSGAEAPSRAVFALKLKEFGEKQPLGL